MIVQEGRSIESESGRPDDGRSVNDGAGRIGRAVHAVAPGTQHFDALVPGYFQGEGQGQLLVPASPAGARHTNGGLAAG